MDRWSGIALVFTVMTAARAAHGQSDEEARRMLLSQALEANNAGDHARALALAQQAGRIRMNASVRHFIAQREIELGLFGPAMVTARLCELESVSDPRDGAHVHACHDLVGQLSPQVGRLMLRAPSPTPAELRVTIAGTAVSEALLGTEYPVTPGAVVIDARAPGREPFHVEITVAAGATASVDLALPESAPAPTATPVAPAVAPTPAVASTPAVAPTLAVAPTPSTAVGPTSAVAPTSPAATAAEPAPASASPTAHAEPASPTAMATAAIVDRSAPSTPPTNEARGWSPVGPVFMGAGVVAGVAGVLTWVLANGQYDTLRTECRSASGCAADASQRASSVTTMDTAAGVLIYGGAALFVGGAALLLLVRPAAGADQPARARLYVDPARGIVGVSGSF